jgi:tetratricopeptide (TPR) repeat protein
LTKIQKFRNEANALYLNGNVKKALNLYKKIINNSHYSKKVSLNDKINDLKGMVNMCRYLGIYDESLKYAKEVYELNKKDYHCIYLLSASYLFSKNYKESIKYALIAQSINDNKSNIYDILSEGYMHLEKFDDAKKAGIKSLKIKEEIASSFPSYLNKNCKIITFNEKDKSKNIISFSLFGNSPRYCENAVINAQKVVEIYPSWTCRFYCSSDVPIEIISRLKNLESEVIIKEKTSDIKEMLFWRFFVMSDSTIDRYIVRDCDSVISQKEALAVKEWITSDKKFHILRDYYTHTDLILAGMFGGVCNLLENVQDMIKSFLKERHSSRTHLDQDFLRKKVWGSIKNDVLIHDSCFNNENSLSVDFPSFKIDNEFNHIGSNEGSASIKVELKNLGELKKVKWTIHDKNDAEICTYHTFLVNNFYIADIPNIYAKRIQNKEYFIKSEPY